MSKSSEAPTVLGIQIHYCDAEGKRQQAWIDVRTVKALTWYPAEAVQAKPGNSTPGQQRIPKGSAPSGGCSDQVNPSPGDLCWYDGAKWVCGMA